MGLGALAGITGAGNMIGGFMSGVGNQKGARASAKTIKQAQDANQQALTQQQATQQPYAQAGQTGLEKYRMGVEQGAQEYKPYSAGTFGGVNMSEDPGVKWRMDQSNKALNESAAAKGGLFSGWQQRALQENAQNLASQEYNNAYNRQYGQFQDTETANRNQYNLDRDYNQNLQQYNMQNALNLSNIGQNAANTMSGNIGNANAQNMNLYEALASANAAKARGKWGMLGDAISSGTNTGANVYTSYLMGQ